MHTSNLKHKEREVVEETLEEVYGPDSVIADREVERARKQRKLRRVMDGE